MIALRLLLRGAPEITDPQLDFSMVSINGLRTSLYNFSGMTQHIDGLVKRISSKFGKAAILLLVAANCAQAETVSFNAAGDFANGFTQKAGTGGNQFEEVGSIGVGGTRAIRRTSTGTEYVSYISNTDKGGVLGTSSLSLRFNYTNNSTGVGGKPLVFEMVRDVNPCQKRS